MNLRTVHSANPEIQQILIQTMNDRILSPDKFVQSPANTQNYNRYSYCLNNPMKFTDPSGYFQAPHYNWSYQDLSEPGGGGGAGTIDDL